MSRKNVKQFGLAGGPWLSVPGVGGVFDVGTTVPTSGSYAPGAIFIDIDASAGAQLWVNDGNATTPSFRNMTNSTGGGLTNASISGNSTYANNANLVFNTTNGSMLGTGNTQKVALWGATPVVQPSSTGELVGILGFADNSANATNMNSNGNSGTKRYSFNDVVKALKQAGILLAS